MPSAVVVILFLKAFVVFSQNVCQDGCCESDPRCTDFDFIMTACLDTATANVCPVTCKTCATATAAPAPTTTAASCQDTNPKCFEFDFIINGCKDPTQATLCPQMCGLCSVTTTSKLTTMMTTTMPTTTTEQPCEDTDSRCVEFEFLLTACLDSEQAKICPKICGLCGATTTSAQTTTTQLPTLTQPPTTTSITTTAATTTTQKPCQDTDPQCFDFNFIISACSDNEKAKQCPQMCGLCTTPPPTTAATTTTTTTTTPVPTTAACVDTDSRCTEFDFIINACADPVQARICPRMCQLCDAS